MYSKQALKSQIVSKSHHIAFKKPYVILNMKNVRALKMWQSLTIKCHNMECASWFTAGRTVNHLREEQTGIKYSSGFTA